MIVTGILCSFRLVLKGKVGKEIEFFEFFEKISASNFALANAEENTSGPLNREEIAGLSLMRTLLVIHQKL